MKRKLGVIGYGTMGSWHAENVRDRIKGLDVAAVYDIDPKRRDKAKEDGFCVYDSVEEFFKTDIDLVLIATPNNFHKYYSIMAMEQGKNVVCEKPACMSVEEVEEVLAVSKKTGKLYTVHQNRRFDIDYVIAKKLVEEGKLGKLFMLESRLYSNRGFSKGGWKAKYETGGGRSLEEYIIHQIEMTVKLLGADAKSVQVFDRNRHSTVLVEFGEEKIATLNYSTYAPFVVDAAVAGEAGTQYKRIESSEYFYHLIESILVFFKSEKPPFDAAQTIAAIAIRDAIVKGKALPFDSKVDVVK